MPIVNSSSSSSSSSSSVSTSRHFHLSLSLSLSFGLNSIIVCFRSPIRFAGVFVLALLFEWHLGLFVEESPFPNTSIERTAVNIRVIHSVPVKAVHDRSS